jgi:hypothetical protein
MNPTSLLSPIFSATTKHKYIIFSSYSQLIEFYCTCSYTATIADQDLHVVLRQKVILTKDNLAKHKWNGCPKCVFCDSNESINHSFFECPLARLVWRVVFSNFDIVPLANVTYMLKIDSMGLVK